MPRVKELEFLLQFIESTYFSQSIPELVHSSAEFFVNRFGLANCYVELFGKYYRFFTNNQISKEYSVIEDSLKPKLAKNRVPIFLAANKLALQNRREHSVSAFPMCIGKDHVGNIFLYGNKLFETDARIIKELISKLLKAAITVKNFSEVKHSAITDTMTGLYNKTYFAEILQKELKRARSVTEPTSLIILDIDDFKQFNDTKGHMEGDILLKELADILKKNVIQTQTASRFGGEEFVILLPSTKGDGAYTWAECVRKEVEESLQATISLGICTCMNSSSSSSDMMKNADIALYKSKKLGKNKTTQVLIVDRSIGPIEVER